MEDLYSRQNSENQTRLHHLVELIAHGRGTNSVIESLHHEEARKKTVVGELSRLDDVAQVASLDAAQVAKEMRSRLDHLPPSSLAMSRKRGKCFGS